MSKIFEVEGNLTEKVREFLVLELGTIQSKTAGNGEFEITVYDARDGIEDILRKHGLRIIRVIDKKAS